MDMVLEAAAYQGYRPMPNRYNGDPPPSFPALADMHSISPMNNKFRSQTSLQSGVRCKWEYSFTNARRLMCLSGGDPNTHASVNIVHS